MFSLLFFEGCGLAANHADSLAVMGPVPQYEGIPFQQQILMLMG